MATITEAQWASMLSAAEQHGRTRGLWSASWLTPDSPEDALELLRMSRDELDRNGKSATLQERFTAPNLSGVYSDDPETDGVLSDAGFDRDAYEDEATADVAADELLTAWEEAASEAFYQAIDAQAAAYLRDWIGETPADYYGKHVTS